MHTNFTFCSSFWGSPDPYWGFAPGPQTPWPGHHHVNPLHCKILGTPMPGCILIRVQLEGQLK